MIIGYESTPVKQVVALSKLVRNKMENQFILEKQKGCLPIDYATLKACPELEKMEYFGNPQGSLFQTGQRVNMISFMT